MTRFKREHGPIDERCKAVSAEFGFIGPDFDPADVSRLMGMEPDRAHRKGEVCGRSRNPRPLSLWFIDSSKTCSSSLLREHLEELRLRLSGLHQAIESVRVALVVLSVIDVSYEAFDFFGGFDLPGDLVGNLAPFVDEWTIRFIANDEEIESANTQ